MPTAHDDPSSAPPPTSFLLRYYRYFHGIPFVRDIATMQVGRAFYMGLTLVSSIVFARILGVEGYGLYAVVLAFVGTIRTFTNLGQASALQVFLAEQFGRKNLEGMAVVLRNFAQMSGLNGLILILLGLAAPWISQAFYGNSDVGSYARLLFFYSAIDAANSGVIISLQAVRSVRIKTLLEQGENAMFIGLAILGLALGWGIHGIVVGQLAASIIFLPISFLLYMQGMRTHGLPDFRQILSAPQNETAQYRTQGLWFSVDKNIGGLYPSGLFFALSLVAPPATVGIARIALQLGSLPQTVLLPQVSELSTTVLANTAAQGKGSLRKNAAKVVKHSLFFHALISFTALMAAPILIPLFYGKEFAAAVPLTLWIILLALPMPLTLLNSPLARLFRKIPFSLASTVVTFLAMWSAILFLTPWIGPAPSFLLAYVIGVIFPLALTVYLFRILLRPEHT